MSVLPLVAMAMGGDTTAAVIPSFGTAPHVSAHAGGSCSGPTGDPGVHVAVAATITVSWTVLNGDAANFGIKVYKDGILKSTQGGTSTSYTYTVSGFTENPPGNGANFTSAYVFRADIYKLIDGTVVDSHSASSWVQDYGNCTSPA